MDITKQSIAEKNISKTETKETIKKKAENKEAADRKQQNKDESICEHHADEHLLEDQHEGTVVCSTCGVVVVEQIICGVSEWRTFGDDNQSDIWARSRVGGPANEFLSSAANLSTTIRSEGSSRHGTSFNSSILRAVKRKSVDNGIFHGLRQLDEMAARIHLPKSVLDYAQYLYYKMYKKANFKGIALRSDAKVSACLYIACYHAQCPRTVNEICGISENGHQSIRRAIQRITKILNLPVGAIEYRDVMPRYCAWLSLPHHIEKEAVRIAETLTKLDEHRQFEVETLSATSIYFASQQSPLKTYKRTQKEIAESLGITPAAISGCYRFYRQN